MSGDFIVYANDGLVHPVLPEFFAFGYTGNKDTWRYPEETAEEMAAGRLSRSNGLQTTFELEKEDGSRLNVTASSEAIFKPEDPMEARVSIIWGMDGDFREEDCNIHCKGFEVAEHFWDRICMETRDWVCDGMRVHLFPIQNVAVVEFEEHISLFMAFAVGRFDCHDNKRIVIQLSCRVYPFSPSDFLECKISIWLLVGARTLNQDGKSLTEIFSDMASRRGIQLEHVLDLEYE